MPAVLLQMKAIGPSFIFSVLEVHLHDSRVKTTHISLQTSTTPLSVLYNTIVDYVVLCAKRFSAKILVLSTKGIWKGKYANKKFIFRI